ncbi:MAG: hypothetical protein JWQ21_1514, partial [Herminiimonas sp.]|nr:hypothetical protein [Herminiimonas sp.]
MKNAMRNQSFWKWLAVMLTATTLAACGGGGSSSGTSGNGSTAAGGSGGSTVPVLKPLTASAPSPADKATGVPLNTTVALSFNVPIEPATIVSPATTFTLKETGNGNTVAGAVRLDATGQV